MLPVVRSAAFGGSGGAAPTEIVGTQQTHGLVERAHAVDLDVGQVERGARRHHGPGEPQARRFAETPSGLVHLPELTTEAHLPAGDDVGRHGRAEARRRKRQRQREVGLGGELRQVHQTARRLAEAARLGFRRAVVPASAPLHLPGIEVIRVATLEEAVAACADELRRRRAS